MNNIISELTDNKLILLFIFDSIDLQLTNAQITELVMKDSLMNYFLLQQYLSDLINKKLLSLYEKGDKKYYDITLKGKKTLQYFVERIPFSTREKILKSISKKKDVFKQESEIFCKYIPRNENEYIVECKIIEKGTPLLELKFLAGTKMQAQNICNRWKKHSQKVYFKIVSALTSEE